MAFWATQNCGGNYNPCLLSECGSLGLRIEPRIRLGQEEDKASARLSDSNYIAGLIYNILAVDAQDLSQTNSCAGNRGGYWADTFTGNASGTNLRSLLSQADKGLSGGRAQRAGLIAAAVKLSLQKLTDWGVAQSVDVKAQYVENGVYKILITADTVEYELIGGSR